MRSRLAVIIPRLRATSQPRKACFDPVNPGRLYRASVATQRYQYLRSYSQDTKPETAARFPVCTSRMAILDYIEHFLTWIFKDSKGHDSALFTKSSAFASFPEPTITITSPDCGPSNSTLKIEYTQFHPAPALIPALEWSAPSPDVKQYVLLCEDPDSPSKIPSLHGLWYGIPSNVTKLTASDFELVKDVESDKKRLKGGFKLGKNRRGTIYTAPRPLLEHGPHRYMFELIALKEELDEKQLSPVATKDELAREIVGKVAAWGVWIGIYENKWKY